MSSTPTPSAGPSIVKETPQKRVKSGRQKQKASQKAKPARILPTDRITFDRQLNILRAYAAASDNGNKATRVDAVAEVVNMAATTLMLANPFFTSIGLLQKTDAGFLPAAEVVNFLRAYSWNPETASYKLAPLIEPAWFSQTLIPKLRYGTIEEEQAITDLAETAAAAPDYRKQLRILIDYMVAAGLVQRDGNQIKLAKIGAAITEASAQSPGNDQGQASEAAETQARNRVLTAFTQTAEGAVNFNVQVRVEMTEFSGWQADRIAAFFAGIAQVLAAKAKIEKDAGT